MPDTGDMGVYQQHLRRVSSTARTKRWSEVLRRFPRLHEMRVLDLGGDLATWQEAPVRPRHVTSLNLDARHQLESDWFLGLTGDACAPPERLMDRTYDLAFSNSLLEHVGGHAKRKQLAEVILDVAPQFWVQTPYRYFPVEPHWMVPGMQFLPLAAQAFISRRMPFGPASRDTPLEDVVDACAYVELVSLTQFRDYFPGAAIWRESFLGLTKSLVAVRAFDSH